MNEVLEHHLGRFLDLCEPGPFDYPWCHHQPGTREGTHVVFTCLVHGDEYGTLPAAVQLVDALQSGRIAYSGPMTIALGNPEAARRERRFIDFDLNRAWVFEIEREGHEPRRARELRPILDAADLLLDLHQTILASESPFWIFPWRKAFGRWARYLGSAPVGLTRPPGQAFAAQGLRCVDEYVRDRGKPGFCIEFGQKGFDPLQADNAFRTMQGVLELQERIDAGETTLDAAAREKPPIRWYTTVHKEPWGPDTRRLAPGLINWSEVRAGVDLARPGSPPIVPGRDGVVLFPKYPLPGDPLPSHQFHLATPLDAHPDELYENFEK